MTVVDVKCPECGGTALSMNEHRHASDHSMIDVFMHCRGCETNFEVDYRPVGIQKP
jgi:DNA-directed RNA polymerase subunit M/transcription elongation factor TFIIS